MNPSRKNQTKPNQTQTKPLGAGGVSRSRVQVSPSEDSDGLPPWSERRSKLLAYVTRVLPGEHPGLAASAALSIKMTGRKPTPEAILERLEASGRSTAKLRERGWIE
jgi:hypothetical protein